MENKQIEIGSRIREVRKQKGLSQTELANMLDKSLRTIQKYESGEIEVSIAMINELAKKLNTTPTYLIGYESSSLQIESLSDVCAFLFQLEKKAGLKFDIDVKKPKTDGEWKCSITFDGRDQAAEDNSQLCLFLEDYANHREQVDTYWISPERYEEWQNRQLAYHATADLPDKEAENLTAEERVQRRDQLLKQQFNQQD